MSLRLVPPEAGLFRDWVPHTLFFVESPTILSQTATESRQALADVRTLSGMLPICASCRRVRADEGDWNQLEVHLGKHAHVQLTHGI